MRKNIVFLLVVLVASGCTLRYEKTNMENEGEEVSAEPNNTAEDPKSIGFYEVEQEIKPNIDTLSLRVFWNSLQESIVEEQKRAVVSKFNFPIRAIYPVLFKYAHDCDTLSYVENEEKYHDFDITLDNVESYYDFVFTEELKKVVTETSIQELLSKGYFNDKMPGLTYSFYPKDYDLKTSCVNDHNMKFNFIYKNDTWKITISGL